MNMFAIKSLILTITLFIICDMSADSQLPVNNYEKEWKKVDELVKKELPKSALTEVKKIYALAKKEKQEAQIIKSLVYITNLQADTRENNEVSSIAEIEKEIVTAEEAIYSATGSRPKGFRGPGFSWSNDLLEVLRKRNYIFDASVLPTYISPLMRRYYFWKSKLSKEEKESRKELFGSFKEGFYPLKPFRWNFENKKTLLEIPVTTMPVFKIPFHQSYLLYISGVSIGLMKMYLRFAIFMCKITKTQPSYLLHPLDLIGKDHVPSLAFFPGMNIKSEQKLKIFGIAIQILKENFELLPMSEFSRRLPANLRSLPLKANNISEQKLTLANSNVI